MAFSILALRTSEDTDSTIWPVPARQPAGLLTEPESRDGCSVVSLPVIGVSVSEVMPRSRPVAEFWNPARRTGRHHR